MDTPYISVDFDKVTKNIIKMQSICNKNKVVLRPHIKTHKSIELAKLQIEAGAIGISCAKISEAEVMAAGGIDDIFIAYPIVGENKLQRAIELSKRVKRLILTVDSIFSAVRLGQAACQNDVKVEVRLEIDTGAKRTGVSIKDFDELYKIGDTVCKLPYLNLTGLFTFKSLILDGKPTLDRKKAAEEECKIIYDLKLMLEEKGIIVSDLSVGSTPTGVYCAETGLINEIRPGTYIFNDMMSVKNGSCNIDEVAASIFCTVVSVSLEGHAVIDGGSKVFPTDIPLNQPPLNLHSYGYIVGRDDLRLDRINEEHGMIRAVSETPLNLRVEDILEIIPTHICTAINLQNHFYISDKQGITKSPVDARGMVE